MISGIMGWKTNHGLLCVSVFSLVVNYFVLSESTAESFIHSILLDFMLVIKWWLYLGCRICSDFSIVLVVLRCSPHLFDFSAQFWYMILLKIHSDFSSLSLYLLFFVPSTIVLGKLFSEFQEAIGSCLLLAIVYDTVSIILHWLILDWKINILLEYSWFFSCYNL